MNNVWEALITLEEEEVVKKGKTIMFFQMYMIRRFPQIINSLNNENGYEHEVKKYSRLLLESSDHLLELTTSIEKKEKENIIRSISYIAEFILKISNDKPLLAQLHAFDQLNYFKHNKFIVDANK